jgi:hypothetical protein
MLPQRFKSPLHQIIPQAGRPTTPWNSNLALCVGEIAGLRAPGLPVEGGDDDHRQVPTHSGSRAGSAGRHRIDRRHRQTPAVGNGAGVRGIARVYPERVGCENQHSTCLTWSVKKCFRSFGEHPRSASAARSAVCSTALSGQAPKPHSGAPKARSLTAKARKERRLAALHWPLIILTGHPNTLPLVY